MEVVSEGVSVVVVSEEVVVGVVWGDAALGAEVSVDATLGVEGEGVDATLGVEGEGVESGDVDQVGVQEEFSWRVLLAGEVLTGGFCCSVCRPFLASFGSSR